MTLATEDTNTGLPSEEIMSSEDGVEENKDYVDLRWIDWNDYENLCSDEQEILDFDGDLYSEDALFEFDGNIVMETGLDAGVASTVAALAASGACPITSCSGETGHAESRPIVLFWAESDLIEDVTKAAKQAKVTLSNRDGVFMLHADNVDPMLSFAEHLFDLRAI